jgi:hypothetical protein
MLKQLKKKEREERRPKATPKAPVSEEEQKKLDEATTAEKEAISNDLNILRAQIRQRDLEQQISSTQRSIEEMEPVRERAIKALRESLEGLEKELDKSRAALAIGWPVLGPRPMATCIRRCSPIRSMLSHPMTAGAR